MKNQINKFKYRNFLFLLLIFGGLVSCNSPKKETKQVTDLYAMQVNQVQDKTKASNPPTSAQAEKTVQVPAEPEKGVVLNPPHGQPGHRCDIPVGSPLNSPAAKSSHGTAASGTGATAPAKPKGSMAPTLENARRLNPSQAKSSAAPETGAKPANNPPHGQPWHRCDIAVGSPLP